MKRSLFSLALALAMGTCLPVFARAQDAKPQDQKTTDTKKEEQKKDSKVADYEKAVKDLPKYEGAFTLYQKKKDILIELPEDKLDRLFLVQAALETGGNAMGLQAGDPLGGDAVDVFKFERHDDQVWLIRPNLKYRWNKDDPLSLAADRSMPNAILGSFRVEQSNPEKKLLLINATNMFTGDLFRLNEMVNFLLGGAYMLDRDKSGVEKINATPESTVVEQNMHFFSPRGAEGNALLELLGMGIPNQLEDDRSFPVKVAFNIWWRDEKSYMPRMSDPRVGFFTTDFYNMDRFLNEDRTERFIARWDLQKKDPKAPLSEPVKPIVWVIDNSVPPQYRDAVKAGILRWNKAFEAIGYKNALVVIDQPNDPNYNHADGRQNVVRFTVSENMSYAVSLPRFDPFSGRILSASITFDANMLQAVVDEHDNLAIPTASAYAGRAMQIVTRDPKRKVTDDFFLWATPRERMQQRMSEALSKFGWQAYECEAASGLAEQANYALQSIEVHGLKVSKEEYAKEFVSSIIAHEMGHCLGLRHNFLGSTNLTTAQLADENLTAKEGVTASVMDYTPVNIQAVLRGSGDFFGKTVGSYDLWAIKYGYSPVKADTPLGEKYALSQIASRSTDPGHAYNTDENADGWDPYVVRFDNAKDPIEYSAKNIESAKKTMQYAISRLPKAGESYSHRNELILTSIVKIFREGRFSSRFVGGIRQSRNFKGNTLSPVDAKTQRDAISLIVRQCLQPNSFELPSDVLNSLSLDQNGDQFSSWNAPLRDILSGQQQMLFASLMSANTTDRIAENSFKSGANAYRMDEHFGNLLGAVFAEVGAGKSISPLRRDLQRFAVAVLMQQSGAPQGSVNDDVRMLASDSLRRLSKRFGSASQQSGLDGMTKVYLRDTKQTIDRFLNRTFTTSR